MKIFLLFFLLANSLFAQNITISQKDFDILVFCRSRLDFLGERNQQQIPAGSYVLPIRQVIQYPNLCVPASASMILGYYGENIDQRDIKRLASNTNYSNNDGRLYSWTLFAELINGLRKIGYNWREIIFNMTDQGYEQGYNLIVSEIRSNRPVLCDSVVMGGHAFVVHGITPDGSLIISDPSLNQQYRILHKQDFKQIWCEFDGSFRSVILTSRKQQFLPRYSIQLPR